MRVPTYEELRDVAKAALEDPRRSLAARFDDLVWGGQPPAYWGQQPVAVVRAWDVACTLWRDMRPEEAGRTAGRHRRPNAVHITPEQAWQAIVVSMAEENPFLRLSWRNLGMHLNVGARSAEGQLGGLGFVFVGVSGTSTPREIVQGPCVGCSEHLPTVELDGTFHCRCCSESKASPQVEPGVAGLELSANEEPVPGSEHSDRSIAA